MATYLVINTGGTIGMVPSDTGLTPKAGIIAHALHHHPRLTDWHQTQLRWIEWQPLLDSSELQPAHWLTLKQQIDAADDVDGVLIVHGTDTLAYTACALSFILSPRCPVVITAAMRPIGETDSDAIDNLTLALTQLQSARCEIIVAVHQALPASKVTKVSTQQINAFNAPNWHDQQWHESPAGQTIAIKPSDLDKIATNQIGVFTFFPGCSYEPLEQMIQQPFRAIVLQSFGDGNTPSDSKFRHLLEQAQQAGVAIFVRSQCADGSVTLGKYAASSLLTKHGAIACGSLTLEATLTKLMLLSATIADPLTLKHEFLKPYAREWQ